MTPDQLTFWKTNGYLIVENAISPAELRRAGEVFDREAKKQIAAPAAEAPKADTRIHIGNFLDADDIFIDIAAHPRLMPILQKVIGEDLILIMASAFAYPPGGPAVYWHSDLWHFIGMDLTRDCYMARMLIFLDDVEPDGGCLAYVPGSHRLDQMTIVNPPRFEDPEIMPNHVKFAVPAGTAVIFNAYGWHARLPNKSASGRPRRTLQYGYEHQWVHFLDTIMAPKNPEKIGDDPLRRQLFGLKSFDYSYERIEEMLRARMQI